MKIPASVLNFAGETNLAPYAQFRDYYNQYRSKFEGAEKLEFSSIDDKGQPITFEDKEKLMNAALKREILRVSGIQNFTEFPLAQMATHPTLGWATFAVISSMVDMILPETIISSIGIYTDVRTIGWGDSANFEVDPKDIFVVSKAGRNQRTTEMHKQFRGNVTIVPEPRELTVGVSLYRVLSGHESLAVFVSKMVRAMETQVTLDAYDAFAAAMAALPTTATTGLQVAGYSQASLVRLCQQVGAWNGGAKPIIMGTQLALVNILPDDANYRYTLNDEFMKLGYVRTAFGYDILALPQVADHGTEWALRLASDRLWIVSPSAQKLLKLVLEGSTVAYTDNYYDNANLLQRSTLLKSWGVAVATNSIAAVMTV